MGLSRLCFLKAPRDPHSRPFGAVCAEGIFKLTHHKLKQLQDIGSKATPEYSIWGVVPRQPVNVTVRAQGVTDGPRLCVLLARPFLTTPDDIGSVLSSKARNEPRFDRVDVRKHPPKFEALLGVQSVSSKTVHLCANPALQLTTDRDLAVVGQHEPSHTT